MNVLPKDALAAENLKLAPLLAQRDDIKKKLDTLKKERDNNKATAAASTTSESVAENCRLDIARLELEIAPYEQNLRLTPKLKDGEKRPADWKPTTADLVAKQEQIVQNLEEQILLAARTVEVERYTKEFAALHAVASDFVKRASAVLANLRQTNIDLTNRNVMVIEVRDFPNWDFAKIQLLHTAYHANSDEQKMKLANDAAEAAAKKAAA